MRVLVTNDDGILAPGLPILAAKLKQVAEVYVIAPESQQSAVSHSITLHKPLRMTEVNLGPDITAFTCSGTPVDCVVLSTRGDLPDFDFVVSGINAGANLGEAVFYSGTVGAACEGALHDVPGIAISVCAERDVHFEVAADLAPKLVTQLAAHPLPPCTVLNVNLPNVPADKIAGIEITRLGRRKYTEVVNRRDDPGGRPYYWIAGTPTDSDSELGTDINAIQRNCISVTPVHFDLRSDILWEGISGLHDRGAYRIEG